MNCFLFLFCLVSAASAFHGVQLPFQIKSMQLKFYPNDSSHSTSGARRLVIPMAKYTFSNLSGANPLLKDFQVKFSPDNPAPGSNFRISATGDLVETLKDSVIVQLKIQMGSHPPAEATFDLCELDDPEGRAESICPIPAGKIQLEWELREEMEEPTVTGD
jgi:hypothetical protein